MATRCLVALAAGVALALAFPPTHAFWLLPLAVAVFFVVTAGLPARRAWVPGLAFGVGFQFTLLWWMHVVGTVPWLGLSATQAAWYGILGAAVVPLRRLPAAPAWLAVAWVAMEQSGIDPVVVGLVMGLLTIAYPASRADLERATDLFRVSAWLCAAMVVIVWFTRRPKGGHGPVAAD